MKPQHSVSILDGFLLKARGEVPISESVAGSRIESVDVCDAHAMKWFLQIVNELRSAPPAGATKLIRESIRASADDSELVRELAQLPKDQFRRLVTSLRREAKGEKLSGRASGAGVPS